MSPFDEGRREAIVPMSQLAGLLAACDRQRRQIRALNSVTYYETESIMLLDQDRVAPVCFLGASNDDEV